MVDGAAAASTAAGAAVAVSDSPADAGVSSRASSLELVADNTTADRLSGNAAAQTDSTAGRNNGSAFIDAAIAGAQGATALAAREGLGAARARGDYLETVSGLNPDDSAGRSAAKAQARAATPPVTRAAIESVRPDLGPRPGSVGSANRTNSGANQLAGKLGTLGRGAVVVGVAIGATRIATADNKVEEAVRVGGGALGGIASGALVGAQLGAMGANPVTIAAGAVVGGIVGGIAGEAAVNKALDWARSWF